MKDQNKKKILIVRNIAIGDVIHTLNVPRAIKNIHPEIEIHFITNLPSGLLDNLSYIDKVKHLDDLKFMKIFSKNFWEVVETLKQEQYDLVINLQPSVKSRAIMFFAGIKKVYNYRKCNKNHAVKDYWLTAKRAFPKVELQKDLNLVLNPTICLKMQNEIKAFKSPYIVFNAGHVFAKRQGRTYPIEKWLELGHKIQEKYNGTIIITGVKNDAEILKPLESIENSISFVDKLTLEENSALLGCANLVISGDSGPLHIAAALGVNTLGIFGSMPITRTGPYGEKCYTVVSAKKCSPCNRRKCKYLRKSNELYAPCMKEIEVDEIFKKVCEILN